MEDDGEIIFKETFDHGTCGCKRTFFIGLWKKR